MVKEEDGLAVLDPIPVSLDLKEVAWEDWNSLILQILKKGPYQNLILDVSESVQGLFDILKICDVWYLPISKVWRRRGSWISFSTFWNSWDTKSFPRRRG